MFNFNHYIPILKWKRAEQGALKMLDEKYKKNMTPLIQFVMPRQKPKEQLNGVINRFEEQIEKIPKKIIEAWGMSPVFVDFSLLYTTPLKIKSIKNILQNGYQLDANFIPVIHLSDEEQIKEIVCLLAKKNKSGFCLRLICTDFADLLELNHKIQDFLATNKLSEKEIDLLVDIKEININDDKYIRHLNLSQNIHNLLNWRTFSFASGAFPKDLSECKFDEQNLIPRLDWKNWINQNSYGNIRRKPTFADYTIQHPIYKESLQFFHPTTSIKYTLKNEWLVMKGKKQKFELYLANAKLLSEDRRFYGENFSYGDKYITEKAQHYQTYIKNPKKKKVREVLKHGLGPALTTT